MRSKTLYAGRGEMDFNRHMKDTAILDKAADIRMLSIFAENSFPMTAFSRLGIGPVLMKDEIEYRKKAGLLKEIAVTLATAGGSPGASLFLLRSEICRADWTPCARINSSGGWRDYSTRKLVAPPPALFAAVESLPRTGDFVALPSSVIKEYREAPGQAGVIRQPRRRQPAA